MPVKHAPPTPGESSRPSQYARTQGVALVVVLLAAMILMVSLLAVSSTMTISSQRTTADREATLQAQYAAESGLSYARTRTAEAFALFPLVSAPTNTPLSTLKAAAIDFCGTSLLESNPDVTRIFKPQLFCKANKAGSTPVGSRNFTIFTGYLKDVSRVTEADALYVQTYPVLADKRAFWRDVFSGGTTRSAVAVSSEGGLKASFVPDYGFIPDHVDAIPNGYRLYFKAAQLRSTGTLEVEARTVASKRLEAQPSVPMFSLDINRECFCEYNYFANRRSLPGGGYLVFGEADRFSGKVHVNASSASNGAPYFRADTSAGGPRFAGGFSTAAADLIWSPNSPYRNTTKDQMFASNYQFGKDPIVMPDNANSQRRAVSGDDSTNLIPMTDTLFASKYGKSLLDFGNGVYYGNSQQKGTAWAGATGPYGSGGIYVRGDVSDLRLTTDPVTKLQIITIVQLPPVTLAPTTTTFTQRSVTIDGDGNPVSSWSTTEKVGTNAALTTTITSGAFNGLIFVDGAIGSSTAQATAAVGSSGGLGGEGLGDQAASGRKNETADIAALTKLTIAARDDIYIKRNLTYADDPAREDDPQTATNESAYNLLGIYSEKGNIKVDGVNDKPLKLDATLMAVGEDPNDVGTAAGKGFGTIDYNTRDRNSSGNNALMLELTGGIIEEQSQGIGTTGRYGYSRNFTYDRRFTYGVTPPFFPTQGDFTSGCLEATAGTASNQGLDAIPTELSCTRDSVDLWRIAGGY